MADPDPYHNLKTLLPEEQANMTCGMYDSVYDMAQYAKFPMYVHLCYSSLKARDYNELKMIDTLSVLREKWLRSVACAALTTTVLRLKNAARITNIVCISHGSFMRSARSIMQHLVAWYVAELLTDLYSTGGNETEAGGTPLDHSIAIISQDPAYSDSDDILLESQPHPIRVVPDPEALLAINSSSLVMSHAAGIPLRSIVADLAESGKGPAAVFWDKSSYDTVLPDVDNVTVPMLPSGAEHYFVDAKTRRVLDLLDGYDQVMHAEDHPMGWWRPEDDAPDGLGEELNWFRNMEMWLRRE